MSALIIGGIAFMCGGAIGAAWFVATMKREKSKRKNKRKWYREEKPKRSPLEDLMWTATPRGMLPESVFDPREIIAEKKRQAREGDPDALLFETEAAPNAEQPNVMGPYVWNTDQYVNGNNYGPSGNGYLRYTGYNGGLSAQQTNDRFKKFALSAIERADQEIQSRK